MAPLSSDPPEGIGIVEFGRCLRRGRISAEAVTGTYLERISALDPRLGAFTHVAAEQALAAARAVDRLLAAGIDLGPLMGVPVAVKDLFTVQGMPTTAGSKLDVSDLVGPEGGFVKTMKRAGCIILGKTKTTEFALGGVNLIHQLPWNPCDATTRRMPGGSSHGSAVAMAAGLCALSVGSDAGGSVRQPAALCGVFGYKASPGIWPTDGVFPLSTTMDSIGIFSASARDTAAAFAVLTGRSAPEPRSVRGLRLGKPANHYFDDLDPEVEKCVANALAVLEAGGAEIVPVEVPETSEIDTVFARMLPAELIATLGRERFLKGKGVIDPVAWERALGGLELSASDYITLLRRHHALCRIEQERMRGLDGWVTPTVPGLPIPVAACSDVEKAAAWNKLATRNTRPGNLFGQCGVSIPIQMLGAPLPVGLQIMCALDRDDTLLSIAIGIEDAIGRAPRPDLSAFA